MFDNRITSLVLGMNSPVMARIVHDMNRTWYDSSRRMLEILLPGLMLLGAEVPRNNSSCYLPAMVRNVNGMYSPRHKQYD